MAVDTLLAKWASDSPDAPANALRTGVRHANVAVHDAGLESGRRGMGTTITALGFYADINGPGNVVFQATLSVGPNAYFFWQGSTGLITEIAREGVLPAQFASEMITLNDADVVAFTSGAGAPESAEQGAELTEMGLHTWSRLGGVQNMIQNGDTVNGFSVTGVQAQHPNFRQHRQMNSAGCVAAQFLANGADAEDAAEGDGAKSVGVAPAGQLFVSCALQQSAAIPTLSTTMLALFALALAAIASLILLTRKG